MKQEINITYILKKLCERTNLSYFELSNILNRTERQMHNYINNHEKPSNDVFTKVISLIDHYNLDIYSLFEIEDDGYLYHASSSGLVGKISTLINKDFYNDFGNGFYLSETLKNAITYVLDEDDPVIYRFNRKDVIKGNLYSFKLDKRNGEENWVLYIGLNRGKIIKRDSVFFERYFDSLFNDKDILIGDIADSYNFEIMDSFFDNQVDINQAIQALRFADIGLQYVLKNEDHANRLLWVDEYTLDVTLKKYLIELSKKKKESIKNNYRNESNNQKLNEELTFDKIKQRYIEEYGKRIPD